MPKALLRRGLVVTLGTGAIVLGCVANRGSTRSTPRANDCVTLQMGDRTQNGRWERYHYRFTNDCEDRVLVLFTDNSTSATRGSREMGADVYRSLDEVILSPGDDLWTSVNFAGADIGSEALGIYYCARYVDLTLREQADCGFGGDPFPGERFIPEE